MHRLSPATILAVFALSLASAAPALAWNTTGHRLSALIALELVGDDVADRVIADLRNHPRFETDFEASLRENNEYAGASKQDQRRLLFGNAAAWPDIARRLPEGEAEKYDRRRWHYINEPIYLSDADRDAIPDPKQNRDPHYDPSYRDREELNIVQALKRSSRILSAKKGSRTNRAVALCWLFHLTGDAHQPLHAVSLYSQKQFPSGDKGANAIRVRVAIDDDMHTRTLHAVWDAGVGRAWELDDLQRTVRTWMASPGLAEAGRVAAKNLDYADWIEESTGHARASAYSGPILDAVAAAPARPEKVYFGRLSPDYLRTLERISTLRIVEAGHRLAAELERLYPPANVASHP